MEVTVNGKKASAIWTIPKAMLSLHSEFFRKACYGPFKEGRENKMMLPECEPSIFQIFVQWLYFATLPEVECSDGARDIWLCWTLGDRLIASAFKDRAMRAIYVWANTPSFEGGCRVLIEEIRWYLFHSTSGSLQRQFIVDCLATDLFFFKRTDCEYTDKAENWKNFLIECPDFAKEVLCASIGLGEHGTDGKPLEAYLEATKNEQTIETKKS